MAEKFDLNTLRRYRLTDRFAQWTKILRTVTFCENQSIGIFASKSFPIFNLLSCFVCIDVRDTLYYIQMLYAVDFFLQASWIIGPRQFNSLTYSTAFIGPKSAVS